MIQKCIYCGKKVKVSRKGHLLSHLNGAVKCVGIGQEAKQMAMHLTLLEAELIKRPRTKARVAKW